jgi:hypothetical protein
MLLPAMFKKIKSKLNTVTHSDNAARGGGGSGGNSNGHNGNRCKKKSLTKTMKKIVKKTKQFEKFKMQTGQTRNDNFKS